MSLQSVRQFFAENAPDIDIIELNQSTAAVAHNVEPGQIAKTLSLKVKDQVLLVVAKGDARLSHLKLASYSQVIRRQIQFLHPIFADHPRVHFGIRFQLQAAHRTAFLRADGFVVFLEQCRNLSQLPAFAD